MNKINTWDNICKQGWIGPGFFHLCRSEGEMVNHLFMDCEFTQSVWNLVLRDLEIGSPSYMIVLTIFTTWKERIIDQNWKNAGGINT